MKLLALLYVGDRWNYNQRSQSVAIKTLRFSQEVEIAVRRERAFCYITSFENYKAPDYFMLEVGQTTINSHQFVAIKTLRVS